MNKKQIKIELKKIRKLEYNILVLKKKIRKTTKRGYCKKKNGKTSI
jgi:hypothetical protein